MNKSFTKKITKKNIFYIILICFILSVIPLYVIGMFAHPSVDDYYYGTETVQVWNETHSIASVVKCSFDEMINTYNIWQGNFSAIFLMRLQPGIFGEQYYFIAPLILLSAYMGFSIFFFYTALKKIFKADSYLAATVGICLTFVSMQLCTTPSDSFYWYNGAIYYTFFYSLMLFLFALLIRMRTAKAAGTIILTAISSVSAFLIGGSNYAAALFMCIILALSAGAAVYFVILRKNKVIRPYHMAAYLIVAAAAMAGLFISMAAPGNALRQQSVGGSTGIVKTFVYDTILYGMEVRLQHRQSVECSMPYIFYMHDSGILPHSKAQRLHLQISAPRRSVHLRSVLLNGNACILRAGAAHAVQNDEHYIFCRVCSHHF